MRWSASSELTAIFVFACMSSTTCSLSSTTQDTHLPGEIEDTTTDTNDSETTPADTTKVDLTDSILPLTECSPLIFSDAVCGHGESIKLECGACANNPDICGWLTCSYEEGEGANYILSTCECFNEYLHDDYMHYGSFVCNWRQPVPGHTPCSEDSDCPSSSTLQQHCIVPAHPHYLPFCAPTCNEKAECPQGSYCDVAFSNGGDEIGSHCIPEGLWSVLNGCPGSAYCACEEDADCYMHQGNEEFEGVCIPGYHGDYCVGLFPWCGTDAGCWWGYGDHYMSRTVCGYYPTQNPDYPDYPIEDVCMERITMLCRPCTTNIDCIHPWFDPESEEAKYLTVLGDECLSYGDAGSFCGNSCWEDGGCPFGFSCIDGQCMSDSGTCGDCPAYHVELGSWTYCHVTNEHGSCEGTRHCASSGLTDCDAPTPAPETCNGIDDNCDGVTDEGFPDSDGDGFADCVD